jgi:hypothetical protein
VELVVLGRTGDPGVLELVDSELLDSVDEADEE